MPRARLTPTFVRRLTTTETQADWWDTAWRRPGSFGIRVTRAGTKSWQYLGRDRRRRTLGRWPDMSLDDALAVAEDHARTSGPGMLVSDLYSRMIGRLERSGAAPLTIRARESTTHQHLLPVLESRRVRDIRPADLQALIDQAEYDGLHGRAVNIASAARWLFADVVVLGELDHSPAAELRLSRRRTTRREDAPVSMLATVWQACGDLWRERPDSRHQLQYLALQLQIATLNRSAAVLTLHRDHLDGDWWDHPGIFGLDGQPIEGDAPPDHRAAFRTKNGRPCSWPVAGLAAEPLRAALQAHDDPFVFRSEHDRDRPQVQYSHEVLRQVRAATGLGKSDWWPHRCRSIGSTALDRAGVPLDHIQRVLSHSRPRSTATLFYVVPERRDPVAAETWRTWWRLLSEHLDHRPAFGCSTR